ncbi:MAG TPA: exosortase O [Roseiflexaceae bacterium]|nr:exosortase O [Roseiflexaceae bacterium]
MNQSAAVPDTPRLAVAQLGANALLLGLWLWLFRPVLADLAALFGREDMRTNQLILLGVAALIALRVRRAAGRPRPDAPPRPDPAALVLAGGCAAGFLAAERFLDINALSVLLFGLGSYGLLGLWLRPHVWRQGFPAALLLIGALPFGDWMQVFIGYPMRVLTATLVRDGLVASGVGAVGVDTILVFESGVSQVDLPCSGVKSLWTGGLFLLAATWIERRPLRWRWLLTALLFAGLLFGANLARVAVLVVVGEVLGWRDLAEMLHVPLGVLGFVLACLAAVALLRRQPALAEAERPAFPAAPAPAWLVPGLLAALLLLNAGYAPHVAVASDAPPVGWRAPGGLATEPLELRPGELDWLMRDGAEAVERVRFHWGDTSGTLLLVTSSSRRAHHYPERCFEAYGLTVEQSVTHLAGPNLPLRLLDLRGAGGARYSAAYWFQSAGRVTDDYGTRFWDDLAGGNQRWVLVSLLFDTPQDPNSADVRALSGALSESVRAYLGGE